MFSNFYNRFLTCSFIGTLGEYMVLTTLSWYLLEKYNNLSIIGTVLSFRIIPRFFMGFVGGYLADSYNKKRMMILLYFGILLASFIQTILITSISIPPWYLLAITLFFRSIFDGAEPSVRNAILPHIVSNTLISRAVGYYSTALNLAAILAPMLAAFLMRYISMEYVFWIDWLLQIPSFIILFQIPCIEKKVVNPVKLSLIQSYKEAFFFIYRKKKMYRYLIISISMMLLLFPFGGMLSMYVKEELLLGIDIFGYISAVDALGAVLAGVLLAKVYELSRDHFSVWYVIGVAASSCLILLYFKYEMYIVYVLIFFLGMLTQLFRSFSRIFFQKNTPDQLRGRVMSIIISDSSIISLGLPLFTWIAEIRGVGSSFLIMGICSIVILSFLYKKYLKYSS